MKEGFAVSPSSVLSNVLLVALTAGSWCDPAVASAITVSDPYVQWYNVGPNNLDFQSGQFIRYGATSVVPNGPTGGTTGYATTVNAATGNMITFGMIGQSSPATPNFFTGLTRICSPCSASANNNPANLTNPFTFHYTNGADTATVQKSLAGTAEIPFVRSITLSGTAQAPTFSWSPPPGTTVNGYRINIYQNNLETFNSNHQVIDSGQVTTKNVGPGVTSYTVTPADFTHGVALATNTQYTIEISALQTRDGSTVVLNNGNVSAMSRVYSNFQILPNSPGPINLPTTTVQNGQVTYGFNLTVAPGVTYNIDPASAIGYIYRTGAGDPNFASVTLPTGNSGLFDLLLWNGTQWISETKLAGGQLFSFAGSGVNQFEVLGINPGVDPENPLAFITAVTFEGPGNFTGTMTPITDAVPEPSTWAMMILGFLCLGYIGLRRSPSATTVSAA